MSSQGRRRSAVSHAVGRHLCSMQTSRMDVIQARTLVTSQVAVSALTWLWA